MTKRITVLVLIVVLLLTTSAFAETKAVNNKPSISFNGTTANCNVSLYYPNKCIKAKLSLYRGATLIASWSKSGTSKVVINGSHSVISGKPYTVKVTGTAGGQTLNIASVTKICP